MSTTRSYRLLAVHEGAEFVDQNQLASFSSGDVGVPPNPERRYTKAFTENKVMVPIASGARREMAEAERMYVEYWRGPLNRERWPVRGRG